LKRILFLTFNDAPSGIYAGQVIDVCRYWKENLGYDVHLLAFISLRGYSENKKKIKSAFLNASVFPMFPKTRNWKKNGFLLRRLIGKFKPELIVARGPFATNLALLNAAKETRICFDARGAYVAELNEYNVVPDEQVKNEIRFLEQNAIAKSHFRLAVSNALIDYWKGNFGYTSFDHVIVPCTINNQAAHILPTEEKIQQARAEAGFSESDIVIAYSGSSAGWQSFEDMEKKLRPQFLRTPNLKLLMLTNQLPESFHLKKEFPGRILQKWVKPQEVTTLLAACDYGWLVREDSVTNQVASPVKFAEYIAAGLPVFISDKLGDYSSFVREHHCGLIISNAPMDGLESVSYSEKKRISALAGKYFTKENYKEMYRRLLS
jgi:hypothetical protein